jgi:hypothetical protein
MSAAIAAKAAPDDPYRAWIDPMSILVLAQQLMPSSPSSTRPPMPQPRAAAPKCALPSSWLAGMNGCSGGAYRRRAWPAARSRVRPAPKIRSLRRSNTECLLPMFETPVATEQARARFKVVMADLMT